jgi:hypothetical protein
MHGNAAAAIILSCCWGEKSNWVVVHTRQSNPYLKASAAGFSYSMLHLVSAAPALCMPQLRPPQPAKMSMVASFAAPLQAGMTQLRLSAYELCWRLLESPGDARHALTLCTPPGLASVAASNSLRSMPHAVTWLTM